MVPPTQLDPTEQDALVKEIGLALLRSAPSEWDRVIVDYRAMGRYAEATGEITFANNTTSNWVVPPDIAAMFARLRSGMYRDGRGTWYNAKYRLDHPSSYNLDYDRDEPQWNMPPPPQAYTDDLQTFPRSDENIPEWLRRRVNGQQPPRFRVARIFDGQGGNGRPLVNRPTIAEGERPELLDYLNSAPVVGPSRGMDVDRLDPDGRPLVPVAFHTDGTWIWPAAVNYYLHNYGISPELELVGHIRRHGGHVPDVDEATRAAAAAFLGRGAPAPPPGPMRPPVPAAPPRRAPDAGLQQTVAVPRAAAGMQPTMVAPPPGLDLGGPEATMLAPRPEAPDFAPRPEAPEPTLFAPRPPEVPDFAPRPPEVPEPTMLAPRPPVVPPPSTAPELLPPEPPPTILAPMPPAAEPPAAALPSQGPPSATIDSLRSRLQDLGVPESAYRIGPPAERGWTMDQTPEGWRVGWYDKEFVAPAMFEDVADAAAFLLGKIMLDNGSSRQEDESTLVADPVEPELPPTQFHPFEERRDDLAFQPPPTPEPFTPPRDEPAFQPKSFEPQPFEPPPAFEPPQPFAASLDETTVQSSFELPRDEPAFQPPQRMEPPPQPATRRASQEPAAPQQRWPIQPLSGEPPLTLFRSKRMLELPPGTEIDRFGNPDGNLTYAVGTSFSERSLVPEWIDRPYHAYRVERPLQVLSGTAIPWFEQIGGGVAYLLPEAVHNLLAAGVLAEIPGRKPA